MASLYPEIEPYQQGMLAVGDGQRLYWEVCGNPQGKPALVLHGGPGSGCTKGARRHFDPARYRIVLFDQRGAGRSAPHASDPGIDLCVNTTEHLIADIEALRAHLRIDRWLVRGGSWGSTLALAYAQRHPRCVTELVLNSVATTTPREVEWITRGVGAHFPAAWARFRDGVPAAERDGNLAAAYHRLLMHRDPAIQAPAARAWCAWEDALESAHPAYAPNPRYDDAKFRLGFARVVTHYWSHAAWLEDGSLLRGVAGLMGIPGILIHGRRDLGTPLDTATDLARSWPGAELIVVDEAGHDSGHPDMTGHIVAATDRFAST